MILDKFLIRGLSLPAPDRKNEQVGQVHSENQPKRSIPGTKS